METAKAAPSTGSVPAPRMEEERQRLYAQLDKEAQQARQQAQTMVERVKSQTDLLLNEMEELKKQQDPVPWPAGLHPPAAPGGG